MIETFYDQSRAGLCTGFARTPIANPPPHQTPSLTRMSEEEAARIVSADVIPRSHAPQEFFDVQVYADNMRQALCDASIWPNLRVALLWCDMSVSATLLSAWGILNEYRDAWPVNGRRINAVRMKNANHFVCPRWDLLRRYVLTLRFQPHWDQPECTMQLLARVLWSETIPETVEVCAYTRDGIRTRL